jgi:xanthine/uracil/vitamin C permease (AzgA family)
MGIIVITAIIWGVDRSYPTRVAELPTLRYGVLENISFTDWTPEMIPTVLAFLFVGIFDVSGVVFGLSSLAKEHLMDPERHVHGR